MLVLTLTVYLDDVCSAKGTKTKKKKVTEKTKVNDKGILRMFHEYYLI